MGLISRFHWKHCDEQKNGLNFRNKKNGDKMELKQSFTHGTSINFSKVEWKLHKYWEEGFPFVGGKRKFIVCRKSYVSKRNQALIQMH